MSLGFVELMVLALAWAAMVAIPVLIVGAILFVVLRRSDRSTPGMLGPSPLGILRERLARGEISEQEFEEGKRLLGVR
jgi:uncharacterized membrane protein